MKRRLSCRMYLPSRCNVSNPAAPAPRPPSSSAAAAVPSRSEALLQLLTYHTAASPHKPRDHKQHDCKEAQSNIGELCRGGDGGGGSYA
jgi:hypothetical protein